MQDLIVRGSLWGYLLDLTKIILVISLRNVLRAEEYFRGMGVHMVNGSRYLNGFMGYPVTEKVCIDENIKGWTDFMEVLDRVVR